MPINQPYMPSVLPPLAKVSQQWQKALDQARPYLFNAAYQVVEAYAEHRWNILICDDASARLPAVFFREVLELSGYKVPLAHICANAVGRAQTDREVYRAYAGELLGKVPDPRPLLITESVGDGSGLRYLLKLFCEITSKVDVIVVASYYQLPSSFGDVYVGGYGAPFAVRIIHDTFESLRVTSAQCDVSEEPIPGALLAGRQYYPLPGEPFIRPTDDPQVRTLATHCIGRMKALAAEYCRIAAEEVK